MNKIRKFALACSCLGFMLATVCLYKTTPLTMMAFFSGAVPLFGLGAAAYFYDLSRILVLRGEGERTRDEK